MISDEEYIKQLGKRIKELRKQKSMTQLDVAVASGMEENAFQRIEAGRTNPTARTLVRISQALDVHVMQLFNFDYDFVFFDDSDSSRNVLKK